LDSIGSLNPRHDEPDPGLPLLFIDGDYATRGEVVSRGQTKDSWVGLERAYMVTYLLSLG